MAINRFFSGCSLHNGYHYGCQACLIITVGKMAHLLDEKFPEEEKQEKKPKEGNNAGRS